MVINTRFIFCLLTIFFISLFLSFNVAAVDEGAGQLPDLVPLPTPSLSPSPLNEPPETYSGQVIIKYTQNAKEFRDDGLQSDEKTLTVNIAGTIYPLYAPDYRNEMLFSGTYLFKEGQMSWSYNAKDYDISGISCEYLTTSVGSGNIDIAHTDKIYPDSSIWIETDKEYTMDINNYGRVYLTADGLPIAEGDYNSAQKPVQMTTTLISGNPKFCSNGGAPTNEVPPVIYIRLENIKAKGKILSGEEAIHLGEEAPRNGDIKLTEMISYTIELPPAKQSNSAPEEPAMSEDNPDKQGLLEIFFNWIKNLFN